MIFLKIFSGKNIRGHDITKHKSDVIRLSTLLSPDEEITIPENIKEDLYMFINFMRKENQDYFDNIRKNLQLPGTLKKEDILSQIENIFKL